MILYRGTMTVDDPVEPAALAAQGVPRHFTPHMLAAQFYGMQGRVATYESPPVVCQPHGGDPSTSPPFTVPVADYEVQLAPAQIAQLHLISVERGRLLPGSRVYGPDGALLHEEPVG